MCATKTETNYNGNELIDNESVIITTQLETLSNYLVYCPKGIKSVMDVNNWMYLERKTYNKYEILLEIEKYNLRKMIVNRILFSIIQIIHYI